LKKRLSLVAKLSPAAAVAARLSLVAGCGLPAISVIVCRATFTYTLGAISTWTVVSPASTRVILPRMPPAVTI
jgi:hypothetical protein